MRLPPGGVPASYPQMKLPVLDNPALFEKLDTEALFFAFYYMPGTHQQYLAARELKRQSWRYHKQHGAWFQVQRALASLCTCRTAVHCTVAEWQCIVCPHVRMLLAVHMGGVCGIRHTSSAFMFYAVSGLCVNTFLMFTQRHEEPKFANEEYEQGTYVYFDYNIMHDDMQSGWCYRLKQDFTFKYDALEDELQV